MRLPGGAVFGRVSGAAGQERPAVYVSLLPGAILHEETPHTGAQDGGSPQHISNGKNSRLPDPAPSVLQPSQVHRGGGGYQGDLGDPRGINFDHKILDFRKI